MKRNNTHEQIPKIKAITGVFDLGEIAFANQGVIIEDAEGKIEAGAICAAYREDKNRLDLADPNPNGIYIDIIFSAAQTFYLDCTLIQSLPESDIKYHHLQYEVKYYDAAIQLLTHLVNIYRKLLHST